MNQNNYFVECINNLLNQNYYFAERIKLFHCIFQHLINHRKSLFNTIVAKLNRANPRFYRVVDFVIANILKPIYYLITPSNTTMFVSYGDKTLAQSTVSTFSKKGT